MIFNRGYRRMKAALALTAGALMALALALHAGEKPKVAIIIDDFGYCSPRAQVVRGFLDCEIPLTASILPCLQYSSEVALAFKRRGKEVILHIPMETGNCAGDEPCSLTVSMPVCRIKAVLREAMKSIPYADGLSNHQGSKFTADSAAVARLMEALAGARLYFIDSRTHPRSRAFESALRIGIPALRRDVFLDVDIQPGEVIFDRFEKLAYLAQSQGYAVGIGHCRKGTLKALRKFLTSDLAQDVEFVTPSQLIDALCREGS